MSRIQQFDYSVDLLQHLLWQYNEAENLPALLQSKQTWYTEQQTEFWQGWHSDVFDLRTATEFGLSVWAVILGLPLFLDKPPTPPDFPAWGFGPENRNFNNGRFAVATGSFQDLTLEQKRLVLMFRYFQLTTDATIRQLTLS